jgi:hypothetical protein
LKGRESLPIRSEIRASIADRIEALRFSGKPRQQRKAPVPSMAGANSIVIQAERERNGLCRFFHFSSRQTRDAIADIAFGNSLEIVKVGSTGARKPIVLGQHHFSGMLRIVDVMGAMVTEFSTVLAESRVSISTGRFLSGALKVYQQMSPRFTMRPSPAQ